MPELIAALVTACATMLLMAMRERADVKKEIFTRLNRIERDQTRIEEKLNSLGCYARNRR